MSIEASISATLSPVFAVQRADERYHADHGWLRAYHSFSFADYYDPNNLKWGALRVFNDDRIAGGTGFPTHPHRDMEIVTYVFSGELAHKDSMGNAGVVKPGGVQFMSAGTGVRHSEYNALPANELHLVQMWVTPGKIGTPPSYGQLDFTEDDRRNRWLTVVSGESHVDAPIRITQDATLYIARLENIQLKHTFAPQRFGFAFVGEGTIEARDAHGNTVQLTTGDAVRLYDAGTISLQGSGEVVLWDVPSGE